MISITRHISVNFVETYILGFKLLKTFHILFLIQLIILRRRLLITTLSLTFVFSSLEVLFFFFRDSHFSISSSYMFTQRYEMVLNLTDFSIVLLFPGVTLI